MSCSNHAYSVDIDILEQENRQMRARMERLEVENLQLQKQVDALIIVAEAKDKERLKVIEEVWKHTRGET